MIVRTKKLENGKINRIESAGEIKEIILNEDFLNPKKLLVDLCFKNQNSSGIVTLNSQEIEAIYKKVNPKTSALKDFKIMKFRE
jgi:hypothetical protein